MRTSHGLVLATALAVGLGVAGCASDGDGPPEPSPTTSQAAEPVVFADTPVGRQATWFVAAANAGPISEGDFDARFAQVFKDALTVEAFNAALEQVGPFEPVSVVEETGRNLTVLVRAGGEQLNLIMAADAEGRIEGLLFAPEVEVPEPPATWEELDARVAAAAPQAAFLAARVNGADCVPLRGTAQDEAQPLGSAFKLYVLSAVARAVEAGELAWDDTLTVTAGVKSWPSGQLQDRPDGAEVTVREGADLMISISDNTATDLLVATVGREAVEEEFARTSEHAGLNTPLLTTKDMFRLKVLDYPRHAEEFLALAPDERRGFLTSAPFAELELPPVSPELVWAEPRDIDTIEWFGSPMDVCRQYADLVASTDPAVGAALSINDGGLGLDPARWSEVWFKGGSEPGVMALAFAAQSGGEWYVVVATGADPRGELPPDPTGGALAGELLSVARGGFALSAEG